MATSIKTIDRRIQRTRQALIQSFCEIVREKGLAATSIREITKRANVNRGTFYAHFTDKYTLLNVIVCEQFHALLTSKLPPASQ
ncbi:MAG TPA: TetR/AcrR family transcriptional regulator [Dictyobacter sp.]|jgi:AcrR family transcriptional regulator|nr:TetR/AcrR family transcriptional regulator [Dictyobacter sp.]